MLHKYQYLLLISILVSVVCDKTYTCPNNLFVKNGDTVRLHAFSLDKPQKTLEIKNCDANKLNINQICQTNANIKLIVHGFAETWNMTNRWDWVKVMKNEMLKLDEAKNLCVIAVDWKELAAGGLVANYWNAIENMKNAGEIVANVVKNSNLNVNNVHCIGFSLGAHMCSMMYKIYYKKFNTKLGRLTGLDPAGPFFSDKPTTEKLHYTDADFVDIIHTSSKFGLGESSGHMNFYADNGLSSVNACDDVINRFNAKETVILFEEAKNSKKYEEIVLDDKDIDKDGGLNKWTVSNIKNKIVGFFKSLWNSIRGAPKRVFVSLHQFFGCSHLMAVRFFIFSINDCGYRVHYWNCTVGVDGKNCGLKVENVDLKVIPHMGYYADKTLPLFKNSFGSFFVNTSSKAPFCEDYKNTTKTEKYFFNREDLLERLKSLEMESSNAF